jgi:hypothetical protein
MEHESCKTLFISIKEVRHTATACLGTVTSTAHYRSHPDASGPAILIVSDLGRAGLAAVRIAYRLLFGNLLVWIYTLFSLWQVCSSYSMALLCLSIAPTIHILILPDSRWYLYHFFSLCRTRLAGVLELLDGAAVPVNRSPRSHSHPAGLRLV